MGCIVVIIPFVSAAKTLMLEKTNKIIIENSLVINRPFNFY